MNRCRWTDPARTELANLIDKAATQKGDAQKATWKQIFDFVADQVPLYMLYHTKVPTGFDPTKLTNFHGASTTGVYFLGVGRTK